MSDEEEFDSEKTQFWLPGQKLPDRPASGDAAGDHEGVNLKQARQRAQAQGEPAARANAARTSEIDFDLTAAQPGSGELDFDLSAGEDTSKMDFDITGEGTVPAQAKPEPAPKKTAPAAPPAARKPVRAPAPPVSSPGSGGAFLFIVGAAIAAGVIYFFTR